MTKGMRVTFFIAVGVTAMAALALVGLTAWRSLSGWGPWSGGMMGGWVGPRSAVDSSLSVDQASTAVQGALSQLGNSDLQIKEIMIFDNQAYAEISEKSTGIGAMEVLVDPETLAVYPEPGPNMMWNLKYSPMEGHSGWGMMSSGGYEYEGQPGANVSPEMPISGQQALKDAQDYLDINYPDSSAGEEADPFYGYYIIHMLQNGKITGIFSVNGFNGAVFPHTWHGTFVEMTGE
jgi:hypothetical protein